MSSQINILFFFNKSYKGIVRMAHSLINFLKNPITPRNNLSPFALLKLKIHLSFLTVISIHTNLLQIRENKLA